MFVEFLQERLWENSVQISKMSGYTCKLVPIEYDSVLLPSFVFSVHTDLIRKNQELRAGSRTDK